MIQTLKNIILLSLCASFCVAVSPSNTENSQNNETESKNSNLQIPANSDKIATLSQNANLQNDKKIAKNAEFESIKTLEFPKDEAEEKQLNELFMAIESLDSDKIQKLVKQNPRLVNLQCKNSENWCIENVSTIYEAIHAYGVSMSDKNREIALKNIKFLLDNGAKLNVYSYKYKKEAHSLLAQILTIFLDGYYFKNFDKNIELIDFLIKYGKLDINFPYKFRSDNFNIYSLWILFENIDMADEYKFKMFKFLIKQKAKTDKVLHTIIKVYLGLNTIKFIKEAKADMLYKYIQNDEYRYNRDIMKKYIYEIFTNYTINDFDIQELIEAGNYFVYTKDIEFINLMIDNGYLSNNKIYESMLGAAKYPKNEDIIKLLKGFKNE